MPQLANFSLVSSEVITMFNEKDRKTERTRSNGWIHCSSRILPCNWSSNPRRMVSDMLLIAASMVGGFIFAALLTDGNVDDDDDFSGGMMIPATSPNT